MTAPFSDRHFAAIAAAILALALFNLTFRLGSETITEWDESLYAISAWEMVNGGGAIAPTFLGQLDYYNTKPPLNIWLIALSFKTFGVGAVSLRLVSVVSAALTVAVLLLWSRRLFGPSVALLAGLILTTCFGFFYVHSGRTGNTDALFTLLVTLVAIVCWASDSRPWQRAWLGPLLAAIFLLRGPAVLMPLAMVMGVIACRFGRPHRWRPTLIAILLFLVPVLAWSIARWRIDGWEFLSRMIGYDLVARALEPLEGHSRPPWYYFDVLQKYQYDWLVAAGVALTLSWRAVTQNWRGRVAFWRSRDIRVVVLGCWAVATLLVPTLMATKASWYLNPFYPVFALGVAGVVVCAFEHLGRAEQRNRRALLIGIVVLAFAVAESRLLWHSTHRREVSRSLQGLLQDHRTILTGRAVFRDAWNHADRFVVAALIGAHPVIATDLNGFLAQSRPGDALVASGPIVHPQLIEVGSIRRHVLYRRIE